MVGDAMRDQCGGCSVCALLCCFTHALTPPSGDLEFHAVTSWSGFQPELAESCVGRRKSDM